MIVSISLIEGVQAVFVRFESVTPMLDLLFPGRSVAFDSSLALEVVTERLQQEITKPARPFFDRRTQLFQGDFTDGRFKMMRIVKGRNSFNPVIRGQLSRTATGTRVDAQLQLHPLVLGILAIFTLIASRIASIAAPEVLTIPAAGLVGGFGVLVLLIMLFATIANFEARKTLTLLSGVVGAQATRRE